MRSEEGLENGEDKLKQDISWRFLLWIVMFILHGSIVTFIYFSKSNATPLLLLLAHVLPFSFLFSLSRRAKWAVSIMTNKQFNPLTYDLWSSYYTERWVSKNGRAETKGTHHLDSAKPNQGGVSEPVKQSDK